MIPPPGMLASRERTHLPNSGHAGKTNRRPAAAETGANGDPFTSPFDDPTTPASGRYPRAI